jgi:hypothetical protein
VGERTLTDADVAEIVAKFKESLLKDLQLEAGKGLLFWARKAFWGVMIALALYGVFGDRLIPKAAAQRVGLGTKPAYAVEVVAHAIEKQALVKLPPQKGKIRLTVPPPDAELMNLARRLERMG